MLSLLQNGSRDGTRTHTAIRQADFKSAASTIPPLDHLNFKELKNLEQRGFEPPTSWTQTRRATKLRYCSFKELPLLGSNQGPDVSLPHLIT